MLANTKVSRMDGWTDRLVLVLVLVFVLPCMQFCLAISLSSLSFSLSFWAFACSFALVWPFFASQPVAIPVLPHESSFERCLHDVISPNPLSTPATSVRWMSLCRRHKQEYKIVISGTTVSRTKRPMTFLSTAHPTAKEDSCWIYQIFVLALFLFL